MEIFHLSSSELALGKDDIKKDYWPIPFPAMPTQCSEIKFYFVAYLLLTTDLKSMKLTSKILYFISIQQELKMK